MPPDVMGSEPRFSLDHEAAANARARNQRDQAVAAVFSGQAQPESVSVTEDPRG